MKFAARVTAIVLVFGFNVLLSSCSNYTTEQQINAPKVVQKYSGFYSNAADEQYVKFDALLKTNYKNLNEVQKFSAAEINNLKRYEVFPTLKYLFGPLTTRSMGGEQKGSDVVIHNAQSFLKDGYVYVPYTYTGQWLIGKEFTTSKNLQIPLPFSKDVVFSKNWKSCTDQSSDEHQEPSFFWYFWDPLRFGCDHKEGVEFQTINVELGLKTQPTAESFPEYKNLVQLNKVNMTFAFGYVEDTPDSDPFTSYDSGMREFQKFIRIMRSFSKNEKVELIETPITEEKYLHVYNKNKVIGTEFTFVKNSIKYSVKVVTSTEIDQMELFTVSFAKEHDAFFGWFGHSRVGNGFDADQFKSFLKQYPNKLNVTNQYQMIYWAGCNSYSYYTKPFFDFKRNLLENDVTGTKSLDIISNGLPSLFSFNAANAQVLLEVMAAPEKNISYQQIVDRIEAHASQYGVSVLVNVLGDEDNN